MYHALDLATSQRIASRDEYLSLFADCTDQAYRIDASPWYLYSSSAAASIRDMAPRARILCVLRHPVQVLASLHSQHVLVGLEPERCFERAVFGSPRRVDRSEFRRSLDYLAVGRFGEQAARFAQWFPPEQLRFVSMVDLVERPRELHLSLLSFLQLDALPLEEYPRLNRAHTVRRRVPSRIAASIAGTRHSNRVRRAVASRLARRAAVPGRDPVEPGLARRITEALQDDIRFLAGVSGRDLSAWLGSGMGRDGD
jgi:hypothetical protein